MFKPQRYSALLAIPALALPLLGLVLSGHPVLWLAVCPPLIPLPFMHVAAMRTTQRTIDNALIATRFAAILLISGGIIFALAGSPWGLLVAGCGGAQLLAAFAGSSERTLAASVAVTGVLLVIGAIPLAWALPFAWGDCMPPLMMVSGIAITIAGCGWALESTLSPALDLDLPRAVARFHH